MLATLGQTEAKDKLLQMLKLKMLLLKLLYLCTYIFIDSCYKY